MIPHDILNQLFDTPPDDDDIIWDSDVIRINNAKFRRHLYTRVDINLSQGIVYFFTGSSLVLKLAIELSLRAITIPGVEEEPEEEEYTNAWNNG